MRVYVFECSADSYVKLLVPKRESPPAANQHCKGMWNLSKQGLEILVQEILEKRGFRGIGIDNGSIEALGHLHGPPEQTVGCNLSEHNIVSFRVAR